VALLLVVGGSCSSDDEYDATGAADTTGASDTSRPRGEGVAAPEVSGPITGGAYGIGFNPVPPRILEQFDYREDEYFISGTATGYEATGSWGQDGKWSVRTATASPYTTRIAVRRPNDPDAFNGTVVVEWLNVTSGMDADPDFGFAHEELLREGYAYVVVSAQVVGVQGGGPTLPIEGFTARPLKEWDPQRYGSLDHPGDEFSYDMFSQAAQALHRPAGVDPLDGLVAERLIATGESQSAGRLVTYVNAVHPVADIYDAFLIHSRGDNGTPINPNPAVPAPGVAHIRSDLDDPVLQVETETDLFGLDFHPARQPDTDRLRTWEIAGTAHADKWTVDYGIESGRQWDLTTELDFTDMCGVMNDGPQRYAIRSAFAALQTWLVDGEAPASGTPLEVVDGVIVRDPDGNALGGVRTPAVEAPIATLSGEPDEGESVICSLFGSTTPFTRPQLLARYPTHAVYVEEVTAAADEAVAAGFLRPADRDAIIADAEDAPIPS
jgi:hypothetical protein